MNKKKKVFEGEEPFLRERQWGTVFEREKMGNERPELSLIDTLMEERMRETRRRKNRKRFFSGKNDLTLS